MQVIRNIEDGFVRAQALPQFQRITERFPQHEGESPAQYTKRIVQLSSEEMDMLNAIHEQRKSMFDAVAKLQGTDEHRRVCAIIRQALAVTGSVAEQLSQSRKYLKEIHRLVI